MRVRGKNVQLFPHLLAVVGGLLYTCFALLFCLSLSEMFDGAPRSGMGFIGKTVLAIAHALIGGVFGFVWPEKGWRWGVWLCVVPVCFVSFFGREASVFFRVVALMLVPACVAAYVMARVHLKYTDVN